MWVHGAPTVASGPAGAGFKRRPASKGSKSGGGSGVVLTYSSRKEAASGGTGRTLGLQRLCAPERSGRSSSET